MNAVMTPSSQNTQLPCSLEKAGKRREAGDGKGCGRHGQKSDWHVNTQPAHLAHVLLAADPVNDRTGREEQQSFEEGMRHEVEDAG